MKKWDLRKIFVLAGVVLVVAAMAVLLIWQWNIHSAQQRAAQYVQTLQSLLPEPQSAVPEARRDNTMPVLSVQGTDFVGILEFPAYGSALPVCANWGNITQYPCRFSGSIYDGSLKIGATSQTGQYDFYRLLSVGDTVIFTDMESNRYTLVITGLFYAQHADQAALQRQDAPLTLFIKNVYAFEYLVVFCDVLL